MEEFAERIDRLRGQWIALRGQERDERTYNPAEPRDPLTGKWGKGGGLASKLKHLATGTRTADLTPKGRAAVLANDAKFGVNRKALVVEVESKLNRKSIAKGKKWFPEAHKFNENLAKRSGLSVEQVTAITALVSPRTAWPQNKRLAERVALTHKKYTDADPRVAAKRMGGGLSTNLGAAIAVARGGPIDEHMTGAKRRSFFNNMLDPNSGDDVTVDTWMQRTAMNVARKPMSLDDSVDYLGGGKAATGGVGAGYVSIAEAVRVAAAHQGITPAEAQAAYWVAVSGSVEGGHSGRPR